ncbi:zyg eleven-related protein 1 [Ditylenchus destructor]|nr:zyg eleven-related protein 1 [Ditylenchus destructor]
MTDETPSNCERFLNNDGLKLFSQCILQFANDATLVVNMMILVGNVAEVKCLRSQLAMDKDFLQILWLVFLTTIPLANLGRSSKIPPMPAIQEFRDFGGT